MSTIEKILAGSIDMHIHCGPDPRVERRADALQVARQARDVGMRAIVLKSHEYPTAPLAYIVNQIIKDIAVFGSIALDHDVGGLNTHAVITSTRLGAKIIWMPTLTAASDMLKKGITEGGITIFNEKGRLLPVVGEIVDIVKEAKIILATGHLSIDETAALVGEARRRGLNKIVITHPVLEQHKLVGDDVFFEYCFNHTMPLLGREDPMNIVRAVKSVGAEHCVMSTDFGQSVNPMPAEGMRMMIATMLRCGLTEQEMETMVKYNPAKLLDLD